MYLHSFLIPASVGGEWSNLNATRLAAGDRAQVSGSIPAAVRTFCSRETASACAGIQTTTVPSADPQSVGHRSYILIYLYTVCLTTLSAAVTTQRLTVGGSVSSDYGPM